MDWNWYNPIEADRKLWLMNSAQKLAADMISFGVFLRTKPVAAFRAEIDAFLIDGHLGQISNSIRSISPSVKNIWKFNGERLFSLAQKKSEDSVFALLFMLNEFYYPVDDQMPSHYNEIVVRNGTNTYALGVVDRIKFSNDIEVESVLIEGRIDSCTKSTYHLDDEYSVYELEYSYVWKEKRYSNSHLLRLNTSHLGWANTGGLLNFPKVEQTERDLDSFLIEGTAIQVYVAEGNPLSRNPVFHDFIYEVAKM